MTRTANSLHDAALVSLIIMIGAFLAGALPTSLAACAVAVTFASCGEALTRVAGHAKNHADSQIACRANRPGNGRQEQTIS